MFFWVFDFVCLEIRCAGSRSWCCNLTHVVYLLNPLVASLYRVAHFYHRSISHVELPTYQPRAHLMENVWAYTYDCPEDASAV